MKRVHIAHFSLLALLALPLVAQAQNPTPPIDPLAEDARIFGGGQATPAPTSEAGSDRPVTPDVLGILSGEDVAAPSGQAQDDANRALLVNSDGQPIGEVAVAAIGDDRLVFQISAMNLPPGMQRLSLHQSGQCDTGDSTPPFASAGDVINMTEENEPNRTGDLPALLVTQSGLAGLAVVSDRLTLDTLLDADGSALIVWNAAGTDAGLATGEPPTRLACAALVAATSP